MKANETVFTWDEFMAFRHQKGMPVMDQTARLGSEWVQTSVSFNSIKIEGVARVKYDWNIFNGNLYERFDFYGDMKLETVTFLQKGEKVVFMRKWAELKQLDAYGTLKAPKGVESSLTLQNAGWPMAKFVLDKLKEELPEGNFGVGYLFFHHEFLMNICVKDQPALGLYLLNGGDFLIVSDEQREKSPVTMELASALTDYLKSYKTVINPDFDTKVLFESK